MEACNNVWRENATCTFCGKNIELEFVRAIQAERQGDLFIDTFLSVANIT
jgi:hypothetical protein